MADDKVADAKPEDSAADKMSNGDVSDREGETFEDAPDTNSTPHSRHPSPAKSTRSLTPGRSPSPLHPPKTEEKPDGESSTERQNGLDGATEKPPRPSLSQQISTDSLDDINLQETSPDDTSARSRSSTVRSSQSSRLTVPTPKELPALATGSATQGFRRPSMPWASAVPSAAPSPPHNATTHAPPPSRKLTSPFSWLSRNTSVGNKEMAAVTSPPPPASATSHNERRDTTSSLATIGSNPELMLSKIGDGSDAESPMEGAQRPGRNSLRDRFKMLRIREEAGIASLGDENDLSPGTGSAIASLIGRGTGLGLGIGSPVSVAEESEGGLAGAPTVRSPTSEAPSATLASAVNAQLPPGTVSGISAGPSAMNDPAAPVDWDLWQSVVYEGPAAVARTSPEELNRAIASGIPSAIRGVVWQVLAQSKNEELEGVYRDLLSRGTDRDKDRLSGSGKSTGGAAAPAKPDPSAPQANGTAKERDSVTSPPLSSSSPSGHSTPATANGATTPTVSHKDDTEEIAKLKANLLVEKKKKAAEDAASLQKLERAIKRDLGARTSYSKYVASAGLQDGLFGVCKAYALFDEGVGYAQGMNFLIMPLLFNMPEEEAFCLLVRLMNHYHVREMFIKDMPGLHLHLYQFERLLEDLEPALYCHLNRRGVNPQLYATQWFLTLFAYRFPLQLVLRIYDLVLSEGLEGAILKFGILLMQKNVETLMGMDDMAALTTFLKERLFDQYIDQAPSTSSILESGFFGSSGGSDKEVYRADVMVQEACAVRVSTERLRAYAAEWEEKVRVEREREGEMEGLKTTGANLAHKIRALEDAAEKFDTEHVQVASELVRTKVENEELRDENESLRGQVTELRVMVEKQPAEVEAQLKEEMERIMKRNLEVQNENRGLEESMTDMEKALVNAKMQYAEINSAHETLKQKWNDLRKALGD